MVNIGTCVRVAQEVRGISSKKMAADLKTTKQQVWRWRNADDMKLSRIETLAEYFNMSLYHFLTIEDAKREALQKITEGMQNEKTKMD